MYHTTKLLFLQKTKFLWDLVVWNVLKGSFPIGGLLKKGLFPGHLRTSHADDKFIFIWSHEEHFVAVWISDTNHLREEVKVNASIVTSLVIIHRMWIPLLYRRIQRSLACFFRTSPLCLFVRSVLYLFYCVFLRNSE